MTESRYYFDANALLKYYHPLLKHHQEEMGILQIRRLVSRTAFPILIFIGTRKICHWLKRCLTFSNSQKTTLRTTDYGDFRPIVTKCL